MGTLASALGVYLSLKIDLPTGATIVCTFGMVLTLMAAFSRRGAAGRGVDGLLGARQGGARCESRPAK